MGIDDPNQTADYASWALDEAMTKLKAERDAARESYAFEKSRADAIAGARDRALERLDVMRQGTERVSQETLALHDEVQALQAQLKDAEAVIDLATYVSRESVEAWKHYRTKYPWEAK